MTRFCKLFLIFTLVLLAVWQLPGMAGFISARPDNTPFTLYSSITNGFVRIRTDENGPVRYDLRGNTYTQREFDSILPFFYVRQLVTDGRFPDSLHNTALDPRRVQASNVVLRLSPTQLNVPKTGLYLLLESMSGRVQLEMPADAMRFTDDGVEFIDMAANRIDPDKSCLFTEVLDRKGFRFPAKELSGNPTARKEYDEGYLVIDDNGGLFHLKMMRGRPYVRKIDLPDQVTPRHVFITEFNDRLTLALVNDTQGKIHAVRMPGYEVVPLAVPAFDPERETLTLFGNLFDWTIHIASETENRWYALSTDDFGLLDSLRESVPRNSVPGLRFTSPLDRYVRPRLR